MAGVKVKLVDNPDDPSRFLDYQVWEDDLLLVVVSLTKPVDLREAAERARQEMEHMLWVGKPGYKP